MTRLQTTAHCPSSPPLATHKYTWWVLVNSPSEDYSPAYWGFSVCGWLRSWRSSYSGSVFVIAFSCQGVSSWYLSFRSWKVSQFFMAAGFPQCLGFSSCCALFLTVTNYEFRSKRLHLPPLKVRVLEVHVVFLLQDLWHLAELIHVQLPDEWRQVLVPEILRQYFLLKLLRVLDQDFVVLKPRHVLLVLLFLHNAKNTSKMWYSFMMNSGMRYLYF